MNPSCHSLQKSDHEGFAQVAHDKRAMGAICFLYKGFVLFHKGIALFHEQIALSLTKNEQFAQKTNEQIPNPGL